MYNPRAMKEQSTADPRLIERFGRKFVVGEVLFQEGEVGHEAFLLQEGKVRLLKRVRNVERALMVLKPGDLFGESALLEGATRSSTAVALTDGLALALPEAKFRTLLQTNASIGSRVLQHLIRRLRELEDQIEFGMIQDPQSRVIAALIKISMQRAGTSLAVSPMELSSRIGLDVDAVRRAVQQLRDNEYVRVVGEKLEILDLEALQKLYDLLGIKENIKSS